MRSLFLYLIMTQFIIFIQHLTVIDNFSMEVLNLTNSLSYLILLSLFIFITSLGYVVVIVHMASKGQKILDTATKVVTITTGSTVLYNNWVKGESSGDNDKKDENKKDEDKKDDDKKDTDKPEGSNESNEK